MFSCFVPASKKMKRSADEDCHESESDFKKIRTTVGASCVSASAGSSSPLVQNSLQPKDGMIEEVHVTNFLTFTSHRFRLALRSSDFDNISLNVQAVAVANCFVSLCCMFFETCNFVSVVFTLDEMAHCFSSVRNRDIFIHMKFFLFSS